MRRNQKAEREANAKSEAETRAAKAAEDAYWATHGDGKKTKAAVKAEEAAADADAKAAAKAEARRQAEAEEASWGNKGGAKKKVTAFDLMKGAEMDAKARLKAKFAAKKLENKIQEEHETEAIVMRENENRKQDASHASGIDAALDALSIERGASPAPLSGKAAYAAFEAANLADLKAEKPGLRKQQYDEILSKMWERSPQNPRNQLK